jgi:hypothetical protein
MNSEIDISIANLPIHLAFRNISLENQKRFYNRYQPFFCSSKDNIPTVVVKYENGDPFIPFIYSVLQIRTSIEARCIQFTSFFERGWFDLNTQYGEIVIRPNSSPENFLRVLYAWRCLENDSLLLHASGLIRNEKGYAFFGPSGSGKTTITRLSQGTTILSDDLVVIRIEKDSNIGARVYGVPFRGDMIEALCVNDSAYLRGLYSPIKDQNNWIEAMSQTEAVARLAACVPFVMSWRDNANLVLELCQKFVQNIPVQFLHFRLDPGFWSLID